MTCPQKENKQLIRDFNSEWNGLNENAAGVVPFMKGTMRPMASSMRLRSRIQSRKIDTGRHGLGIRVPDVKFTIDDMVAEGDKVVVRYTVQGTHKGTWRGISPTGKKFMVQCVVINRIVRGIIAENWIFLDVPGMMTQLGIAPGAGTRE